jgi:hypothetical protein
MGAALDEAVPFHSGERGRNRVRIAGHQIRDGALSETLWISFADPAQDAELIGRNLEMSDPLPERLVEAVPCAAHQDRQPLGCFGWRAEFRGFFGHWLLRKPGREAGRKPWGRNKPPKKIIRVSIIDSSALPS